MKFLVARFLRPPLTSPLLRLKYFPQGSIPKLSHSKSFSEKTEFSLLKFNALQNPDVQFIYLPSLIKRRYYWKICYLKNVVVIALIRGLRPVDCLFYSRF
jgi:hypothetical protein